MKRNQEDRRFIKRDVFTQYCGYNAKMEGYATLKSYIPKLDDIARIKQKVNIRAKVIL